MADSDWRIWLFFTGSCLTSVNCPWATKSWSFSQRALALAQPPTLPADPQASCFMEMLLLKMHLAWGKWGACHHGCSVVRVCCLHVWPKNTVFPVGWISAPMSECGWFLSLFLSLYLSSYLSECPSVFLTDVHKGPLSMDVLMIHSFLVLYLHRIAFKINVKGKIDPKNVCTHTLITLADKAFNLKP